MRPHPGQLASARNLWGLLQGSGIRDSHRSGDVRVQDPYSLRCMPQVHGAVRDTLADVERRLLIEMNSATDNPLVFAADGEALSGGNFHGEPMAFAADFLAIALAELGSISERRTEKLTNDTFSGLPPFLVANAGLNSGFMMAQVTAAALVSENKVLCASGERRFDTDLGRQGGPRLDGHVGGAQVPAGRRRRAPGSRHRAARRGAGDRPRCGRCARAPRLEALHLWVRSAVAPWDEDREMAPDLAAAERLLATGDIPGLAGLE